MERSEKQKRRLGILIERPIKIQNEQEHMFPQLQNEDPVGTIVEPTGIETFVKDEDSCMERYRENQTDKDNDDKSIKNRETIFRRLRGWKH